MNDAKSYHQALKNCELHKILHIFRVKTIIFISFRMVGELEWSYSDSKEE